MPRKILELGYQKVGRWYAIRKVEFFPFDIYLVNEGYVKGKNPVLKWRLKSTLFYYENGYEHSFRGVTDFLELRKFLQRNLNSKFARRVGNAIRSAADELLSLTKKTFADRASFRKNITQFYAAFGAFCAVFQTPELAQMLTPEKNRRLLYQFGLSRDYAARQFAKVEHIYRSRLGWLLKLRPQDALMLLPDEVKAAIFNGNLPRNFKQRRTCALLTINRRTRVYWNRDADALFAREILRYQKVRRQNELVGQVAYRGKAKGRAYVALNAEDFKKIPRGAVLICSMTRYTVVPYLKRVAAIVTDQGGITCHAAIMTRELKVPTLIGTQRSTDAFKTGDLLEVDAERGIVKKYDLPARSPVA